MATQAISELPSVSHLRKQQKELETLSELLKDLPETLERDILLPLNGAAFVPARLYHTNEILVSLGEFHVKRTASQAWAINNRRIKDLGERILRYERENQEADGNLKQSTGGLEKEAFEELDGGYGDSIIEIKEEYNEEEEEQKRKMREIERKKKLEQPEANEPRKPFEETKLFRLFESFKNDDEEEPAVSKAPPSLSQKEPAEKKTGSAEASKKASGDDLKRVKFAEEDVRRKEMVIESRKGGKNEDEEMSEEPKKISRFKQEMMMKKNNK